MAQREIDDGWYNNAHPTYVSIGPGKSGKGVAIFEVEIIPPDKQGPIYKTQFQDLSTEIGQAIAVLQADACGCVGDDMSAWVVDKKRLISVCLETDEYGQKISKIRTPNTLAHTDGYAAKQHEAQTPEERRKIASKINVAAARARNKADAEDYALRQSRGETRRAPQNGGRRQSAPSNDSIRDAPPDEFGGDLPPPDDFESSDGTRKF